MRQVLRKDKGVSEIIGFILVFAIVLSLFGTVVAVYVPSQGNSNDIAFQSGTQSTMSSVMSTILTSGAPSIGSPVTDNFPMGIKGEFFSGTESTVLGYNSQFTSTLSYSVSVGYNYPSSTPVGLINNTIKQNITIGSKPMGLALDTQNDNVYVITYAGSTLYEILSSNNSVIQIKNATPSDTYAIGLTYDPVNNVLYIALQSGNASRNGIEEFSLSQNKCVDLLSIANIPYDVAYDAATGNVYFTSFYNLSQINHGPPPPPGSAIGGGIVYALNTSQNVIIAATYVPGYYSQGGPGTPPQPPAPPGQKVNNDSIYPTGISYDPSNGLLYVDDHNGTNLYGINPVTDSIAFSDSSIRAPWSQAFDSASGVIYVTQSQISTPPPPPPLPPPHNGFPPGPGPRPRPPPPGSLSQVTLVNSSNNEVIGTISEPFYNTTTEIGAAPAGIVYDNSNHLVYVSGFSSGDIYIIDGVNNTYTGKFLSLGPGAEPGYGPDSMLFDPYNGYVYVADFGDSNISVIDGSTVLNNSVRFAGSNLPAVGALSSYGQLYAAGNTPFVTPYEYLMAGGLVVSQDLNDLSVGSIIGSPVSFNGSGNSISLSAELMTLLGSNLSLSSNTPYPLTMSLNNISQLALTIGSNFGVGSYSSTLIDGVITADVTYITLNYFNYTISSSSAAIISSSLYNLYNGSSRSAPNNWSFANYPIEVNLVGNHLSIHLVNNSVIHLQSIYLADYVVNSGI